MDMSKKEYQQFVQDRAKKSPLLKDCTLAFLIGGGPSGLGPGILAHYMCPGVLQNARHTPPPATLEANRPICNVWAPTSVWVPAANNSAQTNRFLTLSKICVLKSFSSNAR